MAKTKQQKAIVIEKVANTATSASAMAFVGFKGLSVPDTTLMRRELLKEGVTYTVVKKRLMQKALETGAIKGTFPELPGEVALATTTGDATLPARLIYGFAKKYKENISLLGGVFEGSFVDKEGIQAIATIPPLQVLRGMFANVILSPISGLVIALNQVAEKK